MGMFDSLYLPCPRCGEGVEFQSKADECSMTVWRSVDDAPTDVLYDVMNEPAYCRKCDGWMALVDPAFPPGQGKPRPVLRAVKVRTPDNPHIHSTQTFLRWWPDDKPFTFADIEGDPTLSDKAASAADDTQGGSNGSK